jgi:hypothetical protein
MMVRQLLRAWSVWMKSNEGGGWLPGRRVVGTRGVAVAGIVRPRPVDAVVVAVAVPYESRVACDI